MNFQNFDLNKNFRGKNFEVIDNSRNYLPHIRIYIRSYVVHDDKMCDRFEYLSVISGHHIYAHAPLERHSRAEENPTMTLHSLPWPDPNSHRGFIICSI